MKKEDKPKLVIVESPAKCTTIKKYLGDNYNLIASKGHIRDLATSGKGGLGVDCENGFVPTYIVVKDKQSIVREIQKAARNSSEVILATDPDREGEAIAWHLATVLGLDIGKTKRLEFHEITRDSISEAIQHPRTIDLSTVSSQETRRILDRIIGFKLSTLIFKKIKSRSAGRVQSAALKLVNDHDLEIERFVPEEYWQIHVKVLLNGIPLDLVYVGKKGKDSRIENKEQADAVLEAVPEKLTVASVKKDFRTRESREPFTTSTLQQEAFNRLKFSTKKTMSVAQSLYEGLEVDGEHAGLISYMRTDSSRLSATFIAHANAFIEETYGKEYIGKPKQRKEQALAQDGHEAIRPTSTHRTPESLRRFLSPDQLALYRLIYNRAIASLMKGKKEEVLTVELNGGKENTDFRFELSHTVFRGYTAIYQESQENPEFAGNFPDVKEGDQYMVSEKTGEQKFTQAPAHYSEAKLVKVMEDVGIGRPSTYASTIELLKSRKYVSSAGGVLTITEQGRKTVDFLDTYFPDIVNADYTAQMEGKLDRIEGGETSRNEILDDFYGPFVEEVSKTNQLIKLEDVKKTGEKCPICGSDLVIKEGKNGTFVGCSNYPNCRYVKKEAKKEAVKTGENCPECGWPLVERQDKRGRKFVGCSAYPRCHYIKPTEGTDILNPDAKVKDCPECGGYLIKKRGKYGTFLGCSNYPNCKHMEKIKRGRKK